VSRARAFADLIASDPSKQYRACLLIGEALLGQGQPDEAREVFRQALTAARKIGCEPALGPNRAEALGRVAQALAQAGDGDGVRQAREAVQALGEEALAVAVGDLTQALAVTGDEAGVRWARAVAAGAAEPGERAFALGRYARGLAEAGRGEEARVAAAEVREAVRATRDNADRQHRALCEAAQAYARAGDREAAAQTAKEALEVLRFGVGDLAGLGVIAALEAAGDREGLVATLPLARAEGQSWQRARGLRAVGEALVLVGHHDAVPGVVADLTEMAAGERGEAQGRAVAALARVRAAGRDHQGLRDCLSRAEALRQEWFGSSILTEVAGALAQAGDFDLALQAVEQIELRDFQAGALVEVADALARAGRKEEARAAIDRAVETAEVTLWSSKANALSAIAEALAAAGDQARAAEVARAALGAVESASPRVDPLDNGGFRTRALAGAAGVLGRAGDVPSLERAEGVAEGYASTRARVVALAGVATAFARAGRKERAVAVCARAREAAATMPAGRERAHMFGVVAEALAAAGETAGAADAARAAREVAEAVGNQVTKAEILSWLAGVFLQADRRDEAQSLTGWAREVAGSPEAEWQERAQLFSKSSILRHAAEVLARAGESAEALAVADAVPDLFGRGDALARMVPYLARAGGPAWPDGALAVAERLGTERTGVTALGAIAGALAEAGDGTGAAEVAQQAVRRARQVEERRSQAAALGEAAAALSRAGRQEEAVRVLRDALLAARLGGIHGVLEVLERGAVALAPERQGDTLYQAADAVLEVTEWGLGR
jgi:tetratricopeptide (TPR) repeat protein